MKEWIKTSVSGLLIGSNAAMFAVIGVILGVILWTTSLQESNGTTINMAGRQRMLSQKMTKELLWYLDSGDEKVLANLANSAWAFDETLYALRNGGQAPVKIKRDDPARVTVDKPSSAVLEQLDRVEATWRPLHDMLTAFLTGEGVDGPMLKSVMAARNTTLLDGMNLATFTMSAEAEGLVGHIVHTTWWGLATGATMLLFIGWQIVLIARQIAAIRRGLATIAAGDLTQRIWISGRRNEMDIIAMDINLMCEALRHTKNGLIREREKLTTILLGSREGIVVTQKGGDVALINPAAERLLGKNGDRIRQEGFLNLLDDPEYLQACLEKGTGMPETVLFNDRVLHFYAAQITYDGGEEMGKAAVLRDVTEQYRLENELRRLSITDGLTGLFNRRHADEILAEERERAARYSVTFGVLLLDVDHFKRFNDDHGHDQGDRVLQAMAEAMKDHFRNVDYCCRYGGEEFCVIMPSTNTQGCVSAAERFRQRVERIRVDDLQVTISTGVAIFPDMGDQQEDGESLLRRADVALYAAKSQGRNRVCLYESDMAKN